MKTVLYVDDEIMNLKLFEVNFREKYNILTALDGFSGLEVMDKNPDIQLIISDMRMPRMNGIEFIKKVKEKYPNKECFILTGFDITEEITEALESGLIDKYFRKPFDMKEMEEALIRK